MGTAVPPTPRDGPKSGDRITMTPPPDPVEADPWAEEDEWQKLAEELGALPPKTREHSPPPSAGAAASSPSAPEQPPHLPAETEASALAEELPDWEASEDAAAAGVSRQVLEQEEAADESAGHGGRAPEASPEAEEDEEDGGGRKRRRRRRRRRKGGSESAQESASSNSTAAASAEVPETGEAEELPGGASPAGAAPSAGVPDWSDTTDPDQAAEVLRDILAHWNVPSWDEIVAGLYRPER
ncbi:hypothetical protein [Thermogemmata fonticola]|uniref:Uncharacterized protein n=1 Tax=Thermogemmata fonticola TaxID=2755323 RepID=A0A7V9AAK6_9BACT|nr:hypothetical protein [Thermogemmata fonticola]MBA2224994.1 hypothetical protein [Thermogemmata fonticola]